MSLSGLEVGAGYLVKGEITPRALKRSLHFNEL